MVDDKTVLVRSVPLSPAAPLLLQLQLITVHQLHRLLLSTSNVGPTPWTLSTSGLYVDSVPGRSVADIIQGSLLVDKGGHRQGLGMIRRGLDNIVSLFDEFGLHALMDMLLHLHRYCDGRIVRGVWRRLSLYSQDSAQRRSHPLAVVLTQLVGLSREQDVVYEDAVALLLARVYAVFRKQGGFADPSLLSLMSNGLVPHLSDPAWKDAGWRSFFIASLYEMRSAMRDGCGADSAAYHKWLWKNLGSIRNLCGEDSDRAFHLAQDIQAEMRGVESLEPRLLPECWLTMSQYCRRKLAEGGQGHDTFDPRAELSIHFLTMYVESIWAVGIRNYSELQWLEKLASWQTMAGHDADANMTATRRRQMISEISEQADDLESI